MLLIRTIHLVKVMIIQYNLQFLLSLFSDDYGK
jgi:hypothetical protein